VSRKAKKKRKNPSADTRLGAMDDVILTLIKLLVNAVGLIPPGIAWRMADILGDLWHLLDSRHRRIVRGNLRIAFGGEKSPPEIRRLSRHVFRNLARIFFEIGWLYRMPRRNLARRFSVSGWEHYNAAFKKGRGVLILTGHMGNWELLQVISALSRHPANIVYRPLDSKLLNRFFEDLRSRFGAGLLPYKKSMLRIMRRLRRNQCVAMLMDQSVSYRNGVFTPFFGRMTCTNPGMAMVAGKSKAPVLPLFLVRTPEGFRIEFGPEIPLVQTGDRTKDLEENTAAYNRALENVIRRYPEQWFWVHRRWKRAPMCPWPREGENAQ